MHESDGEDEFLSCPLGPISDAGRKMGKQTSELSQQTPSNSLLKTRLVMKPVAYPNPQEAVVIAATEFLMEETMKKFDSSHDAHHVRRVRKTALSLAHSVEPKPDLLTVELAALLHDLLDKKYVPRSASADPFSHFFPFFKDLAEKTNGEIDLIGDGRAENISRIVENVSWTNERKLKAEGGWTEWHETCIELHCVQDADRLDAIGAFGIMRCAAYSAAVDRALHVSKSDPTWGDSAIHHFHDKLLLVRDRLKTPAGRRMGDRRHQFMLEFLSAVDEEYNAKP
ncbi:hypothetical protein BOTBODRAFT_27945 [Botryobasidium botryosum FD-172 SS1]|uniref:HD/PDEase domain-containing protein n=1 Tax=Botryobasidium botryosum (strain FD-172 SS1) TaxID=930990 RepID=A0A067MUG3_BOTB1|nr:hypothetical protein BOTBODRAFT_27945 [Botryobasidium botryosum FD-172 SS1]